MSKKQKKRVPISVCRPCLVMFSTSLPATSWRDSVNKEHDITSILRGVREFICKLHGLGHTSTSIKHKISTQPHGHSMLVTTDSFF